MGSSDGDFDLFSHQVNSVPVNTYFIFSSKYMFYFLSMISLVGAIGKSFTMYFLGLEVSWSNTHITAD